MLWILAHHWLLFLGRRHAAFSHAVNMAHSGAISAASRPAGAVLLAWPRMHFVHLLQFLLHDHQGVERTREFTAQPVALLLQRLYSGGRLLKLNRLGSEPQQ
jgi:hypothetical protein